MTCTISVEEIEKAKEFHGHWCPGLALGIRVAELALREVGRSTDEEVVALTECDMCAVDAIQFLVSCTFGKGNLLYRDYGKVAFSFWRRRDSKGIRISRKVSAPSIFGMVRSRSTARKFKPGVAKRSRASKPFEAVRG